MSKFKYDWNYVAFVGDDYFGQKYTFDSLVDLINLINSNPKAHIRVQTDEDDRVLLKPEDEDCVRKIEGFTSLAETYRIFNDSSIKLSSVKCDSKGPGGVYINRPRYWSKILDRPTLTEEQRWQQ